MFVQTAIQKSSQSYSSDGNRSFPDIIQDLKYVAQNEEAKKVEIIYNELQSVLINSPELRQTTLIKNIENAFRMDGPIGLIKMYNTEKKVDETILDTNEKETLEVATAIGLTDKETREKLYTESLNDTLTGFQKDQIMKIQKGLRVDGKYDGEIDGIFGEKSINALIEMLIENSQVVEQASEILKSFNVDHASSQISNFPSEIKLNKNSNPKREF